MSGFVSSSEFGSNLMASASIAVQAAHASESVGNLEDAFPKYQEALGFWLQALKIEQNPENSIVIKGYLETYMDVAERMKKSIAQKKAQQATATAAINASQSVATGSSNPSTPTAISTSASVAKPSSTNNAAGKTQGVKSDLVDYTSEFRKKKNESKQINKTTTTTTTGGRGGGGAGKKTAPVSSSSPKPSGSSTGGPSQSSAGSTSSSTPLYSDPKVTNEYENQLRQEMLEVSPGVSWEDIAGQEQAKQTLQEAVILPNLRPDLFTGLRSPPRGVLLYGPPGTGKTMLARAVATESGFSFFNISASSVTSKYLGEGEKLLKALFSLSRSHQPSVIFFDEIDALMSARKESEHEASRRLKTEFMIQVDGAATTQSDRILVIGATNIPWEIDEAVIRRLVKRIYVPLPDSLSRESLILRMMSRHVAGGGSQRITHDPAVLSRVVHISQGYSGSDLTAMCKEAAMGPIREISPARLRTVRPEEVRPIEEQDFRNAVTNIRPSVSMDHLSLYEKWCESFGAAR